MGRLSEIVPLVNHNHFDMPLYGNRLVNNSHRAICLLQALSTASS